MQYVTLGGDEPMYVYLNEGSNQLSLAANVGTYGSIVQRVNVLIQEFRLFYREVAYWFKPRYLCRLLTIKICT